jgi:hypothetical protein
MAKRMSVHEAFEWQGEEGLDIHQYEQRQMTRGSYDGDEGLFFNAVFDSLMRAMLDDLGMTKRRVDAHMKKYAR